MSEPQNPPETIDQTASAAPAMVTHDVAPARGAPTAVSVPGYRILGVLGRGGMGVVYQAIQEKANRQVALKMILAGAHADQGDQLRFRAEAEAAARLSHPNIVQLYEVGETPEGFPFFSLEYVAGGTLAERLKRGPLRPREAAALIEALARAMQYAHERGIIHRDLKPLNILLAGDRSQESGVRNQESGDSRKDTLVKDVGAKTMRRGETTSADLIPKISDFGLAKQLDAEDGLTRTGAIMGTPAYMAPEQAFGKSKHVGPAADIYALGAMLYECLTGRPPFKGATVADTLDYVRTMEPVSLRASAKEVPPDLETICLHCLHKDPQRRYPSAEALADDLRRFNDGTPISVRPVSNFERTWRWCNRNRGWAAMIAAVATLLIVITIGSVAGLVVVSNQNVEIELKRKEAVEAGIRAEKKREEAEEARKKEIEKTELAKSRLNDALQALKLFSEDGRTYVEDALVPGYSRLQLNKVLVTQLQQNAARQEAGEASIDALRNKAWMYENIGNIYANGFTNQAIKAYQDGLEAVDQWVKLDPNDASALSHRAALLYRLATNLRNANQAAKANPMFAEALALQRKLAGNPQVDQFTPGKSLMGLADSLDRLKEYDESLKLREQVVHLYKDYKEKDERRYKPLDMWCETCYQAALYTKDHAKKKELLQKANEISEMIMKVRPTGRLALARWANVLSDLGDMEYNYGKLAERENKLDEAQRHFGAAHKYFHELSDLTKTLATSPDLVKQMRNYGRSFYYLGLIDRDRDRLDEARANFKISLHIREQLLIDYPLHSISGLMRVDRLFSLVAVGDHATAYKDAKENASKDSAGAAMYRYVCLFAQCVPSVEEGRRPNPLTADDRKLQEFYRTKALESLEELLARGYGNPATLRTDADLAPIRDDPRFKKLLAKYKKN